MLFADTLPYNNSDIIRIVRTGEPTTEQKEAGATEARRNYPKQMFSTHKVPPLITGSYSPAVFLSSLNPSH